MDVFDLFLRGLFFLMGAGVVAVGLSGFRAGGTAARERQKAQLRDAVGLGEDELAEAFRPVNHAGYRLVRDIFNSALIVMGGVLIMDACLLDTAAGRYPNAFLGGVTVVSIIVLMAGIGLFYLLFRNAFQREMTLSSPKAFEADRFRRANMSPFERRFGSLADRLSVGLFLMTSMSLILYAFLPDVWPNLVDLPWRLGGDAPIPAKTP